MEKGEITDRNDPQMGRGREPVIAWQTVLLGQ